MVLSKYFSSVKIKERLISPIYFVFFYVFFSFVLRLVLYFSFSESKSFYSFINVFFYGFISDFTGALILFAPLFLFFIFYYEKILNSKFTKFLYLLFVFIYPTLQIFLFFVEYFFFAEFNSRFNSVAWDYLIYPTEVFVNIWQSYNVLFIIFISLILGFPFSILFYKKLKNYNISTELSLKFKFLFSFFYIIFLLSYLKLFPLKGFNFSDNRILNELGKNGVSSFIYSGYTHNLPYYDFYKSVDKDKAYSISKSLVAQKNINFINNIKNPIERQIITNKKEKRLNVVFFVIESFGSDFWGVLGRKDSLTPYMDKLSEEGMLFRNIYSIGNRTVRGLEGILASVPPLPTESLVKLKFSSTTRTIAQIFKERGYTTLFIYGGRGIFDNMKPFALKHGFDEFIEQKDFKNYRFKTIWGVCDEDIYDKAFDKFSELDREKKNFFATVLSVSNHKPYTYPSGTIAENPLEKKRKNAVKYTDYALGKFFEKAKKTSFYKNTIFVIIADHGARVYGKAEIPIKSYEIPLLIIGPDIKPSLNDTLGSSIDVSPTILDILNFNYKSSFWGRSLLDNSIKYRWVVLNHNRSVGFYDEKQIVVLGLNKSVYCYKVRSKSIIEKDDCSSGFNKTVDKTISVFQTAWDVYSNGLR